MKRLLILLMIAMMSISMIAYGEETTLAETTEEDYTYLDDMSINQLKALDAEIHKRLPVNSQENAQEENSDAIIIEEESPQETLELIESEKDAVEMATDAINFLKEQLVLPESFKLTSISYTSSIGESTFKIVFSAQNSYGGKIDTAAYFTYDEEEKSFSSRYQSCIDLAEARNKLNTVKKAQEQLKSGEVNSAEVDYTSIYIEKAYFLDASESAESTYDIYKYRAEDIDISLIKE